LISQGKIVADSLAEYLERHPEIKEKCSKKGELQFYTTDSTTDFDQHSEIFFGTRVHCNHVDLTNLK
jgi:glutamate racemase